MGQKMRVEGVQPFRINGAVSGVHKTGIRRHLGCLFESAIEKVCCLDHLNRLYAELRPTRDDRDFLGAVLERLDIRYRVAGQGLENIPREGGLVIVANHPFGAIEGVVMAAMLRGLRDDVKILANGLLRRIPEISDLFIGVDVFGGSVATRRNMSSMKEAVRWIEQGGVLVVFPAGEVSHFHLRHLRVMDPVWHRSVGRLVLRTGAPVVPIFFEGANSALFKYIGLLHPRLRTALLPREMLNKQGETLTLRVGEAIAGKRLRGFGRDAGSLTDYLRLRTEILDRACPEPVQHPRQSGGMLLHWPPVAEAGCAQILAAEVAALPAGQRLVETGEFQVYWARSRQIPHLLIELGRLREISFRASGEGTGKSLDVDLYDNYYIHLFLWHPDRCEVIGAYRLGKSDEILMRFGIKGFYTHSLFHYNRQLLAALGPALELGRSFVRPEYQRGFAPLRLLWQGIGQYVARYPRYRALFGPVSISNDYQSYSQQLLVEFLRVNYSQPALGRLVKPRRPFRQRKDLKKLCREAVRQSRGVSDISELLSQMEPDGKGVPILIRHYLKLGGRLLAFNVDQEFNDAIDGLIMVDLGGTDPRILQRYMGDSVEAFLATHDTSAA